MVTRVGRRGQGLKMQTCLEPQVCFLYYFIHFLYYTNVLQVPQWWRTATTTTVTLTTHHSHLNVSNDPKITTTTKKATRVGRWGQGLEIQTHLESQVSFFYYFIHFLYYTNVLQTMNMKWRQRWRQRWWGLGDKGRGSRCRCISSLRYISFFNIFYILC